LGAEAGDRSVPVKRRRRRRRRRRESGGRGFATLLPHILTTGNLAAGFYAIVKASTGDPQAAALAIFVAAIFDTLDGRVARMSNSTSRFGAEYDSIADTVSFGVAPAMIAFHAGKLVDLGWTGWVMAFMYTACAGLRLARFNVSSGRYRGRFDGLPSPAAAGMVVATVWFTGFLRGAGIPVNLPSMLPALGVAVLGLLMVSPIPYRNFKDLNVRGSYRNVVFMVMLFGFLLSKPTVTFFIVGGCYVLSGPLEWYWRERTGGILEELSAAERASAEEQQGSAR
jgi:CDP-diacylglycerol--serine O-phosphatidyltransferase